MYYVKSFDGLTLQTYKNISQTDDIGQGMAINRYIQTPNGWYDINESGTAKRNVNYVRASRLLSYASSDALRLAVEDWRAKIGTRGALTVEWWDGTERWVYARLDSVSSPSFVGDIASASMDLTFSTIEQAWRGPTLSSQSFSLSGKSSYSFSVNNAGDLPVYDVLITLVGGTTMYDPTVTNNTTGHGWQYEDTLTGTLLVNSGAKTISKTYNYFDPLNRNIWFSLDPGSNSVTWQMDTSTADSGTSITFDFYPRYG